MSDRKASSNWMDKVLNLDRRIIYSIVFLCVFIPLIAPLGLPFKATPEVRGAYDTVESLNSGDTMLISCDYGPSSMPETHPMYLALLHHCFRNGIRPIIVTLVPYGPGLALQGLEEVLQSEDANGDKLYEGLEAGDDYVFLGYKAGGQAVMLGIGQSYIGQFPRDYENNDTAPMPIFRDCPSLSETGMIFDIASVGYPDFWIPYGSERAGIPIAIHSTAVSAPQYYPYYQAGQAVGLLGGMKGSAEYEKLLGYESIVGEVGSATKGLDAQTIVHVFIVLSIILVNIIYFMQRKAGFEGGQV